MKNNSILVIMSMAFLSLSNSAIAQETSNVFDICAEAIRGGKVKIDLKDDKRAQFYFATSSLSKNTSDSSSQISLSALIPGYGDFGIDQNTTSRLINIMEKKMNYESDEEESKSYVISYLADHALDSFNTCIAKIADSEAIRPELILEDNDSEIAVVTLRFRGHDDAASDYKIKILINEKEFTGEYHKSWRGTSTPRDENLHIKKSDYINSTQKKLRISANVTTGRYAARHAYLTVPLTPIAIPEPTITKPTIKKEGFAGLAATHCNNPDDIHVFGNTDIHDSRNAGHNVVYLISEYEDKRANAVSFFDKATLEEGAPQGRAKTGDYQVGVDSNGNAYGRIACGTDNNNGDGQRTAVLSARLVTISY